MFIRELIGKYQTNAPRYTSYPTADRFSLEFNQNAQLAQVENEFGDNSAVKPISLYIHVPFCNTLCLFCGCNKVITNNHASIDVYLDYLEKEIKLYYGLIGDKLDVVQLHFGGGSPSWMNNAQVTRVVSFIREYFNLDNAKEIAMELDPRHCGEEYVASLSKLGFNRLSIGVQDFNPVVQKAVNREQTFEESNEILVAARKYGFQSSNVDLIYGLPFQGVATFSETIDKIIDMYPERIALFNYAHIPSLLMPQTRIKESDLPSAAVRLDILQMSVDKLTKAGYLFIGMDHFALPKDELSIALTKKTLQRNFQGYSTFGDTSMLAFGVSAIGFLGNSSYYQNVKETGSYYRNLDAGNLPILRGSTLNADDILRRGIIQKIMCQFELNFGVIEDDHKINFNDYFEAELKELKELHGSGLLKLSSEGFIVTETGRYLIRNIAVVFDKYIRHDGNKGRYSTVI